MTEEKRSAIALSYLTGVGPIRAKRLLALAGSFSDIFKLDEATLRSYKVTDLAIKQILYKEAHQKADHELEFAHRNEISIVDCLDVAYPRRLVEHADSPIVLYSKGAAPLSPVRSVGIVGTRKPTPGAEAFCDQLVEELLAFGVTVYSGLAYGVDITAHRACLRYGVPTVGVLAHGLAEVYPRSHKQTAAQMLETGGLLTEYPSMLRSRREFFPMRNRIIAAQSDAIVVVESGIKGGSMITANLAVGYATPTFAVPGRLKDQMSAGCNALIKTHKANLIESAADIAYVLGWGKPSATPKVARQHELFQQLSQVETKIVDLLQASDDVDIDALSYSLSVDSSSLASSLLELEFKGIVRSLPGKRYTLS